jgi:glucokinase
LKQTIGLPVYVDNDANATAKGEARFGAAKMYTHSAVVTLGTGVGVGIIKNGEIEHGTAIDTEFGHMIIDISENAEECTCLKGKKGCWECYASASALIRDTRRAMDKNRNSLMWQYVNNDINRVDGKTAFACAESGDETAKKVIENYIRYVGVGVSNLSNFGPQAVILAGGVSNQGRKLVKPVQDFVNRNLFPSAKRVDVLEAKFKTGIVGAAALVPVQKSLDKILSMEKDCIKS